ncbi:unnamed protein product [Symbiodinium natans]|uniref:Uncharacterized protein n=1 Tax=Symbiodinium natans TaxID=878477 RepID=A0A812TV81_9DINO|nr:unnamed protein product [Symbiodinium natans]
MPKKDPDVLWLELAEQTKLPALEASLGALHAAGAAAEAKVSPPGYVRYWTGQRTVPYMLRFFEESTCGLAQPLLVALRVEQLVRSPFVDPRGEELLAVLLRYLCGDGAGLRAVMHCCDGETAFAALSGDLVPSVAAAELEEADASATVFVLEGEVDPEEDADNLRARRTWQMDQVLSHPAVLNLRTKHAEHDTAFAVILWETIRYILRRPHLTVSCSAKELEHPVVQALLSVNLLVPRWSPTRLVVPDDGTRHFLQEWINSQHAKLSWPSRAEYNIQVTSLEATSGKCFCLRAAALASDRQTGPSAASTNTAVPSVADEELVTRLTDVSEIKHGQRVFCAVLAAFGTCQEKGRIRAFYGIIEGAVKTRVQRQCDARDQEEKEEGTTPLDFSVAKLAPRFKKQVVLSTPQNGGAEEELPELPSLLRGRKARQNIDRQVPQPIEVPPVKKHGKFQCPRAGQIVGPRRPEKKFGGRATAGFD